jgi:GTP-binding protein HflX
MPAVLVSVATSVVPRGEREERIQEMRRLADSAGLVIVGEMFQLRESPDPRCFVGSGKLGDLEALRRESGAHIVLFDAELSPVQIRNIENSVGGRAVDRTGLILDLFARRARTAEGKLQVELAQLLYALPRLTGRGASMSRLGGGVGTRGPGETKLEVDRRSIRRRIGLLRREIESLRARRETQRARRRSVPHPVIALVGYTNSGKSTLFNALTSAEVHAEDRLFATLDPTVRALRLPSGQAALLVDTVGFIRDLPHELVAAFRATLEEVSEADVLVHVVDAANPSHPAQMEAATSVLRSLGAAGKPTVTAFNKCDLHRPAESALAQYRPAEAISALTGEGLTGLLRRVDECLARDRTEVTLSLPYSRQSLLPLIHDNGRVIGVQYEGEEIVVRAELPRVWAKRLESALQGAGVGGMHGKTSEGPRPTA